MICTLSKEYAFSAAHRLIMVHEGHPCGRLHGHNYTVIVSVRGVVGPDGFVMDYHAIDRVVKPIIEGLDHSILNDTLPNSTSELLCGYLWDRLSMLPLHEIEVRETPKTSCKYRGNEVSAVGAMSGEVG